MEKPNNVGPDGCAIFYRKEKFQILNMSCEKIQTDSSINSQIFIIAQFKHKPSKRTFTLVCLHLKARSEQGEKREKQMKFVMNALKQHLTGSVDCFDSLANPTNKHAVIMCGDFNGGPDENFYNVVTRDPHIDLNDAYTIVSTTDETRPPIKQPTLYIVKDLEGGDVLNVQKELDYMFYTRQSLQLTEILELPVDDVLLSEQGLPNLTASSDHLSLVASFKFVVLDELNENNN